MFYGREKELAELRAEIEGRGEKKAILIYGKRRVGKSRLIAEAAKSFSGIVVNYLCVQSTLEGNIELLSREVCQALHLPEIHFATLFDIVDYLQMQQQPVLLILDEYSYLKQAGKANEIDSYMQRVIDRMGANMKIILCGSFITIMKELLAEDNPLFGRFSLIQHLRELDYYYSALFYQDLSIRDKIAFYAVFGGSPYVLRNLDYQQSIAWNIRTKLLPENGIIRSHIENIMLKEVQKAYDVRILEALGNGKKRYSEISAVLRNNDTGLLEKQLKNLLNMETIQKTEPINKRNDARKKFYEISDNLMRFYFAFVFNGAGTMMRIGEEQYYRTYIEKSMDQFINRRLESIAHQYFRRMAGSGAFKEAVDFGTFWYDDPVRHKNGEFDCVVQNADDTFDFYECKNFDRKMTVVECEEEELQVREVMGMNREKIGRIGFICTGGFENPEDVRYDLIDGAALYQSVQTTNHDTKIAE